jgi:hypothetical protein
LPFIISQFCGSFCVDEALPFTVIGMGAEPDAGGGERRHEHDADGYQHGGCGIHDELKVAMAQLWLRPRMNRSTLRPSTRSVGSRQAKAPCSHARGATSVRPRGVEQMRWRLRLF